MNTLSPSLAEALLPPGTVAWAAENLHVQALILAEPGVVVPDAFVAWSAAVVADRSKRGLRMYQIHYTENLHRSSPAVTR